MKLARHEINANLPRRAFSVTLINANLKQIICCDDPFLPKHAGYKTEKSAVIESSAKIHQITSFIYTGVLFIHEKYAKN